MIKNILTLVDNFYIVDCPNCKGKITICKNQLNCKIFRHGVYKNNGIGINPHAPKELCDKLVTESKIYGCGKPFRVIEEKGDLIAEVCNYI